MATNQPKPIPQLTQSEIERFWNNVDRRGPDECWPWTAGRTGGGYGAFAPRKHLNISAHRVAFLLHYGKEPIHLALHRCDNPPCCNPSHLFSGTNKDNAIDRAQKGRGHQGDKHWSRTNPEKVKRGDDNIARRRPDLMARGDRNGARLHPELHPRGERIGTSKLTGEMVLEIRRRHAAQESPNTAIASEFGVSGSLIGMIVARKIWRHI